MTIKMKDSIIIDIEFESIKTQERIVRVLPYEVYSFADVWLYNVFINHKHCIFFNTNHVLIF